MIFAKICTTIRKYRIEDKKTKHRNKTNPVNNAEIMAICRSIPVVFTVSSVNACKHLKRLFPRQLSHNRFVQLEKGVLPPLEV